MPKAFLTSDAQSTSASEIQDAITAVPKAESGREEVKILVTGTSYGVERVVHELYRVGFAEVREWSKPQPTGRENQVMRILTRYILLG
ncbi:hypothetical protein [Pseudanabaena sp. FACHB-2040]|uniref:hypothetical protein n=1 Tax=Pseudanabaena sp. FACHB-2040 TaxID=2692859 RepID=UPI001681E0EB|nr:hypothetical protein [Pseudanabaena sp. FACHB-2040]MBD2256496.1 hypothetical protein [Pseudanabaena sp. FACHB-2040]